MASIPENFLDLLKAKKAFANIATVMNDGSPQVTPVWFDYRRQDPRKHGAWAREGAYAAPRCVRCAGNR
jgi:hypothetical protein